MHQDSKMNTTDQQKLALLNAQINAVKEVATKYVQEKNPSYEVYSWCFDGFMAVHIRDDGSKACTVLRWNDKRIQSLFEKERELFAAASELVSIENTFKRIGMLFAEPRPTVLAWVQHVLQLDGMDGVKFEFLPNALSVVDKKGRESVYAKDRWIMDASRRLSPTFVRLMSVLFETSNAKPAIVGVEDFHLIRGTDDMVISTPRGASASDDGETGDAYGVEGVDEKQARRMAAFKTCEDVARAAATNMPLPDSASPMRRAWINGPRAANDGEDVKINVPMADEEEEEEEDYGSIPDLVPADTVFSLPPPPPQMRSLQKCVPHASFFNGQHTWLEREFGNMWTELCDKGFYVTQESNEQTCNNKANLLAQLFARSKGYKVMRRRNNIILTWGTD